MILHVIEPSRRSRMLKDDHIRALAIEFGAQWIHVRGFDELKEKNEKLFPTFDEKLRSAIYEESILFFQDLFQNDQPVTHLLDADYTYLNDKLAGRILPGIPGVAGPDWRKVDRRQEIWPRGNSGARQRAAKTGGMHRAPARCCAATGLSKHCSAKSSPVRPPTSRACPSRRGARPG